MPNGYRCGYGTVEGAKAGYRVVLRGGGLRETYGTASEMAIPTSSIAELGLAKMRLFFDWRESENLTELQ